MNFKIFIVIFIALVCFSSVDCRFLRSSQVSTSVQHDALFLSKMTTQFLTTETISENHRQEALKLLKIYVEDHRRFWLTIKAILVVFDFDHNGIVTFEDIQKRFQTILKDFPEQLQMIVMQKLQAFQPIIQRLDMNRNGGIDIKSEGRIIAFILRSILLRKLQHVNVNEMEMAFLELLTMDSSELVDASLNKKLHITSEQQQDVIKSLKSSALTMISISTDSSFNKRQLKKLGLLLLKNLAHIYFDDAVLYNKLMRIQFKFFDANRNDRVSVSEVNNYFAHIAKRMGEKYTKSDRAIVRYGFNRYLKTHFKTGKGFVSWKYVQRRLGKMRRRHLRWVKKAFRNHLHLHY